MKQYLIYFNKCITKILILSVGWTFSEIYHSSGKCGKTLCNSNLRNSGDNLEFDLNLISLQKLETNNLAAFFFNEIITTLGLEFFQYF